MGRREEDILRTVRTTDKTRSELVLNLHSLMMEALRHREQDIIRFIAILLPALGGFFWILKDRGEAYMTAEVYVFGIMSIQLLLTLGALYALSLGYNFRSIQFQKAKIEAKSGITEFILAKWVREPSRLWESNYYLFGIRKLPCLSPPEIIKFPWIVFVLGNISVSVVGAVLWKSCCSCPALIIIISGLLMTFAASIMGLLYFGFKLTEIIDSELKEDPDWKPA